MVRHFGEKVYKLVRQIPKGKVVTYGQIATIIQKSKGCQKTIFLRESKSQKYNSKFKISTKFMPRLVGFVLHQNNDPNVPCHRVVNREGRIAPNFAFGGLSEQKKMLEGENVKFKDKTHVDIENYQWSRF